MSTQGREAGTPGPARVIFRVDDASRGEIAAHVDIEMYTPYGLWYVAEGQTILAPWSQVIEVTQE